MEFQITAWSSIDDLISKIKSVSSCIAAPIEIERKWIVENSIIDFFKSFGARKVRHLNNLQAYLSVDPEVRYRSARDIDTGDTYHYIAYKSDGEMSREEYEHLITLPSALKFSKIIRDDKKIREYKGSKFINKDYYVFEYNNIEYEISVVDDDKNFTYMEIEFADEFNANSFQIPELIKPFIIKEVTNDASYKMKNYWKRTRLKK